MPPFPATVSIEDSEAPYLSVVATARNDDHGGNLLRRMQIFVDAWINQSKRHQLSSELILVEWNPPQDRESQPRHCDGHLTLGLVKYVLSKCHRMCIPGTTMQRPWLYTR